jgi:hypothetical protein
MICPPCREDKHADCPQFINGINPTHCDCQHRNRAEKWADQLRTTMTAREG